MAYGRTWLRLRWPGEHGGFGGFVALSRVEDIAPLKKRDDGAGGNLKSEGDIAESAATTAGGGGNAAAGGEAYCQEVGTAPSPSPPPTTPSKKPVILKKSSTRSFQLPSRPDGKLELIKHDSLETSKFAGTSARAKAKQLARSQLSSNELFDKLIESDTNKNNDASDDKVQNSAAESANSSNIKEASSPSNSESPKKKIEAYDFDPGSGKQMVQYCGHI